MERRSITDGTKWEAIVGYARVVRVGNLVYVSGTTATDDDGNLVGPGDPYTQAKYALEKIERALLSAGATMRDVVRTRMYVTNAQHWEAIAKAHQAFFGDVRPASTLVEVSALIGAGYLIEIEADAVITGD